MKIIIMIEEHLFKQNIERKKVPIELHSIPYNTILDFLPCYTVFGISFTRNADLVDKLSWTDTIKMSIDRLFPATLFIKLGACHYTGPCIPLRYTFRSGYNPLTGNKWNQNYYQYKSSLAKSFDKCLFFQAVLCQDRLQPP